ncbi:MAG: hypothetical protein HYR60_16050 [Acidobacteria bacterium]|nr:hypothetical protein [Acidobacteriota bacterium]
MTARRQPWLFSPASDLIFILLPAFLVAAIVEIFPVYFAQRRDVTPWTWLLLAVGIDVAHVYATLYRTYFDPETRRRRLSLLMVIPVICWVGGVMLYSSGALVFWRALAYVAVFHFVRQQYGFLRLYARREAFPGWRRRLDAAAIYSATLYPLVYWHTHPRSFHWFLQGDFVHLPLPFLAGVAGWLYVAILLAYCGCEIRDSIRSRVVNLPKNLVLLGTALSWCSGIVRHDGDLTFTATNVVAHGIPYMALVWFYQRRQASTAAGDAERRYLSRWFVPRAIPAFVGLLLFLAYVEEGFWDALVWRDHTQFYQWLGLPQLGDPALLAIVVPLLAVPQATHYVLDGFIWRVRDLRPLAE